MSMYNVTASSFVVSKDLDDRAVYAISTTWDSIAPDVLEMCGGECTRDEAMEMVLDANRLEMFGDDEEAAAYCIFLKRYAPQNWEAVVKRAMPYSHCGY